ncbi:P-loop NTPase family protein [Vallitalea guaymasensis]|uniref:Uncharacterized protein n=1 Tax=Vallitalea guaymasensis TaxID=1185412 RepID=A0A8J8M913_9FIRM|nr:hypothetical protein [Vallitalea guaymasensis]QUH28564.1 hypothetical protein HYG85_06370 [Vallitalea guaymasensis]
MERIWITGSSGSGKTTLANIVGKKLNIPIHYNDKIFWERNWKIRSTEKQIVMTKSITEKRKWIYEGNRFADCKEDGRFNCCDTIIYLKVNRFICLYRFIRRYFKYKGSVRPDISEGCIEKIDINIVKYILFDYPKKDKRRQKLFNESMDMGKNVIILKGKKGIKKWIELL